MLENNALWCENAAKRILNIFCIRIWTYSYSNIINFKNVQYKFFFVGDILTSKLNYQKYDRISHLHWIIIN